MKNRPWIMLVPLVVAGLACGPRDITIGSDQDTSGNYWGRNVSKEFSRHQLQTLYNVMNSAETKKEIAALNCGRQLSDHEYSVTLWEEGKYRERIVRLQMTPRLYTDQECLQGAVNHVFNRNVKAIDPGPPIDYGYRDPLTGKPLDATESLFAIPAKPNCPCTPSNGGPLGDHDPTTDALAHLPRADLQITLKEPPEWPTLMPQ